jgi:hypothetical protein
MNHYRRNTNAIKDLSLNFPLYFENIIVNWLKLLSLHFTHGKGHINNKLLIIFCKLILI